MFRNEKTEAETESALSLSAKDEQLIQLTFELNSSDSSIKASIGHHSPAFLLIQDVT